METEKFAKPNGADFVPPISEPPVDLMPLSVVTRRSATIGKLVEALAKAQLEFTPVSKDQDNPYYHSKYADLSTVISATRPALAKNGLVVVQHSSVDVQHQRLTLTSTLAHASDQWIENELTLPAIMLGKDGRPRFDAQSCGAAMTYARRYAYQGLVGVAAEQDDDANSASGLGTKDAAQNVAKKQLEEKLQSPDPKIRAMAQDGLNAIRAKEQGKSGDLTAVLQESLKNNGVTKAHIPSDKSFGASSPEVLMSEVEASKEDGLFDEVRGTVQQVRIMATSAAKGSKPYRKIAIACMKEGGEIVDLEISAFDNFKMSDGTCFGALDHPDTVGGAARLIVARSGKYLNLKDIKQLGKREWDARVGVARRDA